jgi:hypothetical protein
VPLIYAIIRIASDRKLLKDLVVSKVARLWLWLAFALMLISAGGMIASWFIHS